MMAIVMVHLWVPACEISKRSECRGVRNNERVGLGKRTDNIMLQKALPRPGLEPASSGSWSILSPGFWALPTELSAQPTRLPSFSANQMKEVNGYLVYGYLVIILDPQRTSEVPGRSPMQTNQLSA